MFRFTLPIDFNNDGKPDLYVSWQAPSSKGGSSNEEADAVFGCFLLLLVVGASLLLLGGVVWVLGLALVSLIEWMAAWDQNAWRIAGVLAYLLVPPLVVSVCAGRVRPGWITFLGLATILVAVALVYGIGLALYKLCLGIYAFCVWIASWPTAAWVWLVAGFLAICTFYLGWKLLKSACAEEAEEVERSSAPKKRVARQGQAQRRNRLPGKTVESVTVVQTKQPGKVGGHPVSNKPDDEDRSVYALAPITYRGQSRSAPDVR